MSEDSAFLKGQMEALLKVRLNPHHLHGTPRKPTWACKVLSVTNECNPSLHSYHIVQERSSFQEKLAILER